MPQGKNYYKILLLDKQWYYHLSVQTTLVCIHPQRASLTGGQSPLKSETASFNLG